MRVDAELAFVELTQHDQADLQRIVPSTFSIEDHTEQGWGLTVRSMPDNMTNNLQSAVTALLEPLYPVAEKIAGHTTVLRVAAYHDTVTCTLSLELNKKILPFNTQLEITTYPSEDSE